MSRPAVAGGMLPHDWYPEPLPANVVVGERSWVYSSFAFLHYRSERPCGVKIGNDTGVYYTTFFDLGPEGEVEIGDFCSIVGAVISANTRVVIRNFAFLAHEVVLADRAVALPGQGLTAEPKPSSGTILVGENAWIGTRAILLAGAHVGADAIVGAGSVVDFAVPDGAVVAGNPARVVGWSEPVC